MLPRRLFSSHDRILAKQVCIFSFGIGHSDDYQTVDITITNEAERLTQALSKHALGAATQPLILLSFDESHTLTVAVENTTDEEKSKPTYFTCLQWALRALIKHNVFSFFLSTTGKVFQFTLSPKKDPSNRSQEGRLLPIPPYSDIGFDQLAPKVCENTLKIEDVAKVEFMVKLGRPLLVSCGHMMFPSSFELTVFFRFGARYEHGDDTIKDYIVDFAAEKLLNQTPDENQLGADQKLTCLSVRLALDFNPYTADARQQELNLIENHLRVCLQVSNSFDRIKSVAPSEPILGEAARMIMKRPDFKPANALLTEFRRPDIERGPRGEVIMMLMVIVASDMIAEPGEPFLVTDFLKGLFGAPSTDPEVDDFTRALPSAIHPEARKKYKRSCFNKTFADAKMYFNHFLKVVDYQVINRDYLWRMILRGAAIVCANNQAGVDFIIPFCYSDKELGRVNVSGMFWQIKNDARFGGHPHAYLFDAMDPYKLGTYNDQDEDAETGGLPIIRVVAALASKVPLLRNFLYNDERNSKAKDHTEKNPKKEDSKEEAKQTEQPRRKRKPRAEGSGKEKAVPKKQRSPRSYTAYDFYCGGLNPKIWRPMAQNVGDWEALLDQSGAWDYIFKADVEDTEDIRRSQMPGATSNPAHWSRFSSFEKMSTDEFEEEDVNSAET